MKQFSKIETKHVIFVLSLFLFFNIFDAVFSLYIIDKYTVQEQNIFAATLMKHNLFILIKVIIPLVVGLFMFKEIKKFNKKQCLKAFAIGKLGTLFYTEVNTLNILFVYHYYWRI